MKITAANLFAPDPPPFTWSRLDKYVFAAGLVPTFAAFVLNWVRWYRWSDEVFLNGLPNLIVIFQRLALPAIVLFVVIRLCISSDHKRRAIFVAVTYVLLTYIPMDFGWYQIAQDLGRKRMEAEIGGRQVIENECRQLFQDVTDGKLPHGRIVRNAWPPAIQRLRPLWVAVTSGFLTVEFGSGFDHYGYYYQPADGRNERPVLTHAN